MEIQRQVMKQKDLGIIQDSCSPYSSTVLLVPKPGGGMRFCVDYRALNSVLVRDPYPLPRTEECMSTLEGSAWFSTIDITTAFWQVPMAKESIPYTAFATQDGMYEYLRMPMGIMNGSAIFSRFIDEVMSGLKWTCVLLYIDDALVFSKSFEEHLVVLDQVLQRMKDFGLTLNAKKSRFCVKSVRFLGHLVSADGIRPDPDKMKAVRELEMPIDKPGMRSVLGLFSYYRKFCKDFATIAAPLNACLANARRMEPKKGLAQFSPAEIRAFEYLRNNLMTEPVLAHPDWTQPFIVDTDSCGHGLGAILSQKIEGVERVVMFASRALNDPETRYKVYEQETLAVRWASKVFGWYLWSTKVTFRTDNTAVRSVLEKASKGRHLRWALAMQELDYTLVERPGTAHSNADGLSRCHLRSACPYGENKVECIYASGQTDSTKAPQAGAEGAADAPNNNLNPTTGSTTDGTDPGKGETHDTDKEPDEPHPKRRKVGAMGKARACNVMRASYPSCAAFFPRDDREAWDMTAWREEQHKDE